jgi:alpha-tubulin suppressor-like RCC1 family protein
MHAGLSPFAPLAADTVAWASGFPHIVSGIPDERQLCRNVKPAPFLEERAAHAWHPHCHSYGSGGKGLFPKFFQGADRIVRRMFVAVSGAVMIAVVSPRAEAGSVAAGASHSAVVKTTDNTAWTWGAGGNGRLGLGSTVQQLLPMQVGSLSGVTAVAGGGAHTLFLKSDGTVWAAGSNGNGQLGDNSTTQRLSPVQVRQAPAAPTTYLTGVTAIAAGLNFSLALKSDHTVWAWGHNLNGQLGINSTTQSPLAVQVLVSGGGPLTDVIGIAAGDIHALAVKSDGSVAAWGHNANGRLGDGTTTQRLTAVAVSFPGGTVITQVAAGGAHSLARKSDATLWAWGSNGGGRLGDGTTDPQQLTPVQVVGLTDVTTMSAGKSHSVAVESDGTLYTWGEGGSGQLGNGGTTDSPLPGLVTGIADAISVVAAADHTLAVSSTGVVWAFGENGQAQLGDGTTETRLSPVAISEANFAWKVGTPTFSVASGTYTTTKSVNILCETAGATIRYSTDGSEPSASSTQFTTSVSIQESTTLKARAFLSGKPDSNVGTAVYELKVAALTVTLASGTYSTPQTPAMSTSTSGATIRHTTDGSEPTETSAATPPAPSVDASLTLKAKAFKAGWTASDTVMRTYTMKVGTPTLTPPGGSYSAVQNVVVSTVTPGATLHYTTDGDDPTEADPIVASGATVLVDRTLSLKVAGWKAGWVTSDTTEANYFLSLGTVATPSFTPAAGSYSSSQEVALSTATSGAVVRYTLDGSSPTEQSPIFGAPFTISGTTTVKAQAFKADMLPSAVAAATYTVTLSAAETPTLSVASGRYATARTVTITCPTAGATIHYTTSGAEPTTSDSSIASGGTLSVDRAMIVKAKAFHATLPASATVRRDYVITGAIAAGGYHSLALKADSTVWAFGRNLNGQLGDGSTTNRPSPVHVSGLSGVAAIAAGGSHSLALTASGAVMSWGLNTQGQLGDGSTAQKTSPVAVTGLGGSVIVAIAAGASHSVALTSTGTVFAWGQNTAGQLGQGSTSPSSSSTPVQVPGLTGVMAIAAHSDHTLAVKSDGAVVAWGNNWNGQTGDGTNVNPRSSPVAMLGPAGITRIAAGENFSLALKTSGLATGTLWSTGYNNYGQLGDGTIDSRNTPLSGASDVVALEAGDLQTLVITVDGALWVWGGNVNSQIGDGTTLPRYLPTRLHAVPEGLAVDGGTAHSLLLAADGRILGWGGNAVGQLGDGTTQQRPTPVPAGSFEVASNSWLVSDSDQDGLTNAAEYRIGTDPLNADSNGNGLQDGLEFQITGRPYDPDADGDGLANSSEIALGTDPFAADTDGDGVLDGADDFPLDNTKSQATPDSNDHTPPVITLQEPTSAVPNP